MINDLNIEKEVFEAIAEGDEKRFALFFNTYKTRILSIAFFFTKSSFLAEEIVQEVFMSLWVSRNKLKLVIDPGGYLYTIIVNKAIAHIKKQKKQENHLFETLRGGISNKIEQDVLSKEYTRILQGWINMLPSKRKEVYLLNREEHLSIREIAEKLKISEFTVKNHLKSAIKFLKKKLIDAKIDINFLYCLLCLDFFLKVKFQ